MIIEKLKESDIPELRKMIQFTCEECFKLYYPQSIIQKTINALNEDGIKNRASWTHFYVVKENNKIIGCGAIGPYWGSETESSLFTIFVDPAMQGKGIGKQIIKTLEQDEYFIRAKRIEIPASLFAIPFYIKMGYKHKNGELIFENDNIKLEKFNDLHK